MQRHHRQLLTDDAVRSLAPPEQFASYAFAYLDSAQRLCTILASSPKKATFERGSVVLYLTAHATELFLKGAILRKTAEVQAQHDLDDLLAKYNSLYRAKRYRLSANLFVSEYPGMTRAEIAKTKRTQSPVDQLYRYPTDTKGRPWNAFLGIEANGLAQDLASLRSDFERLLGEYRE